MGVPGANGSGLPLTRSDSPGAAAARSDSAATSPSWTSKAPRTAALVMSAMPSAARAGLRTFNRSPDGRWPGGVLGGFGRGGGLGRGLRFLGGLGRLGRGLSSLEVAEVAQVDALDVDVAGRGDLVVGLPEGLLGGGDAL